MNTKKLLDLIQKKFQEKLMAKTGWGRNEILSAYKDAVSEALMENLE